MRSDTETRSDASPLHDLAGQLARFGGVGVIVAGLNYAGFLALLSLKVDYLTACVLSWLPAVALSYVLNRSATFRVADAPTRREGVRFAAAAISHLVAVMAGLYVLVEYAGLAPFPASLINLVVSSLANFIILRLFVFASARGAA